MKEQTWGLQREKRPKEYTINPELGKKYRERITRLIHKVRERDIDTLVFLDRSARPFSWLFREMWKRAHPKEPIPKILFLNIGTENIIQKAEKGFDYDVPFTTEQRKRITEQDEWLSLNGESHHQKNVLVVDEMVATGKSLLRAMRLIQFLHAYEKIYGTGLFCAARGGIDEDKKTIPWLREPGMVGVLELPHTLPLSGAMTQENIDHIQEYLTVCIEDEVENIKKKFANIQKKLEECITIFEKNQIEVTVLREGQKKLNDLLATSTYQHDHSDRLYEKIRLQLLDEISLVKKFLRDYPAVHTLSQATEQLTISYARRVEKLRSLQKLKKEDYGDLKKLHDRHIALRKEIKRIAGER